ncbi:MAG: ABC transporter ATP-binding protein [Lachnospiraceae bacterium]|nr:ABC transporter ATP-binding protein [Lachnospiraceae bacterium]
MIELVDISKIYKNGEQETVALKDVSLTIEDGEFVAIMGTSGSGKSTLLHILGCMDKPTKGTYLLMGEDITHFKSRQLSKIRKSKITFVFQNFALMEKYTAYENIELPLLHRGISTRQRKKIILDAVRQLDIESQLYKLPKEMSGGQQQRVALARALVSGADIILADEPTGALDHATSMELMSILKEYNQKGKTVIIVTHDKEVAEFADKVIRIEDGALE